MRFRYLYDHLDCDLCTDMADAGCPHSLCPHIMENLDDLRRDRAFIEAVEDADETLTSRTSARPYFYRDAARKWKADNPEKQKQYNREYTERKREANSKK